MSCAHVLFHTWTVVFWKSRFTLHSNINYINYEHYLRRIGLHGVQWCYEAYYSRAKKGRFQALREGSGCENNVTILTVYLTSHLFLKNHRKISKLQEVIKLRNIQILGSVEHIQSDCNLLVMLSRFMSKVGLWFCAFKPSTTPANGDCKHNISKKILRNAKDTLEHTDMKFKPQTMDVKGLFNWKLHTIIPL